MPSNTFNQRFLTEVPIRGDAENTICVPNNGISATSNAMYDSSNKHAATADGT